MPDPPGAAAPTAFEFGSTTAEALRIGHVLDAPFTAEEANGVSQVVRCLAQAQAGIGATVAVFSGVDGAHPVGHDDRTTKRACGVPASTSRSLRQCLASRFLDPALAEEVLAWRPDILHFHSVHVVLNVAMATRLLDGQIPYCVTVHGGLFPAALRRSRVKKTLFNLLFERRYLNGARFVHALSPHEAGAIRRHGVSAPILVVPNGVPPDTTPSPLRPDVRYRADTRVGDRLGFLFVGRLDPWQKGLDLLLEAFACAGLGSARLVLAGPDSRNSRRGLERRANRLGIRSQVMFTGPVFGGEMASLMAAADVFVHPSRWEGMSLAVLAAAAAGRACLLTRAADLRGELERAHAAVVVQPAVSSIAAGLRRCATAGAQELQLMGGRARLVAQQHAAWPGIADTLMNAYRGALAQTTPSATK